MKRSVVVIAILAMSVVAAALVLKVLGSQPDGFNEGAVGYNAGNYARAYPVA